MTDWFSVRCVFRHGAANSDAGTYEERVTLWQASDFDDAIRLAESEARQYTDVLGDVEYMGLAQAYRLEDVPRSGSEVFSLMRDSSLDADDYLSAFFDTGAERQRTDQL